MQNHFPVKLACNKLLITTIIMPIHKKTTVI